MQGACVARGALCQVFTPNGVKSQDSSWLFWTMKASLAVVWILLVASTLSQDPDDPVTCEALISDVTSVTCNFNAFINTSKRNFEVIYYEPGNRVPDTFLFCDWEKTLQVPDCYVETFVNVTSDYTDHVTIVIQPGKALLGGEFLCQLAPLGGTTAKKCRVKCAEPPVCPKEERREERECSCAGTTAAVIVLTVVLAVLISAIIWMWKSGLLIYKDNSFQEMKTGLMHEAME